MTRITNDELEKFRLNFLRCGSRHVAPKVFFLNHNEEQFAPRLRIILFLQMRKDVKSSEAAVKVVPMTKVFTAVNVLKDTN